MHRIGLLALSALVTTCQAPVRIPTASPPSWAGPAPGAPAVRFSPDVVSRESAFASAFTADGRTVFFTASDSARRRVEVMMSRYVNGRWTVPEPAPFARGYKGMDPALSPDGNSVYFTWSAPRPRMAADSAVDYDTWVAERSGDGWSAARHIGEAPNSPVGDFYPTVTRDGTLYFDSRRSIPGYPEGRRIFRARRVNGVFQTAEPLPAVINETGASNPYIDPDERYIIFGSGRPGGAGSLDLYISYRTGDGWSTPQDLGPRVNSTAVEFCPMVSPDGRWLYFSRIPVVNGVQQSNEIWVVAIDVLPPRTR